MDDIIQENEQPTEEKKSLVAQNAQGFSSVPTMWSDQKLMVQAWKTASILSQSTIIPETYRGKQGDCLVAIDMANRMGLSPIMIMQNSQVVKGNFTWKGSACKALIDGCGKFEQSEYVEVGDKWADDWGFYLQAINKKTNKMVKGTPVTWSMVKNEGWLEKSGSKWKTMPEQMFKYRSATFFARSECPEVLMGFQTADEVYDVQGYEDSEKKKITISIDNIGE